MASPDLTAYTGLVFYDVDPQNLISGALEARTSVLPEYDPHEGDPDLELMGSLATIAAEKVYAINRVPNGIMEIVGRFLGVQRSLGLPATASIEITVTPDALGVEVPAGTAFGLDLGVGSTVVFLTDVNVVSAANATTVTAAATATTTGSQPNNVPSGTSLSVRSTVTAINSARLAAATSGGADPEGDQSWQSRVVTTLARLTSTLVTPAHFGLYAANWPGVWRAKAVNNWDGSGTVGAQGGYVTVAVRALGGTAVSAPIKTALQAAMDAIAYAALTVVVIDAPVTTITVACQVTVKPSYDAPTVRAAVKAAILGYLNTDTWDWSTSSGSVVYANEIVALADGVDGVDHVIAATVNSGATVTLSGPATLAAATTGSVTVT